MFQPRDFDKN